MNCKLSTLAVLFMASANAFKLPGDFLSGLFKSSDSVDIPQKGGNFDFSVAPDTAFSVNLAGNPTTGFQWYLSNESEVQSSSIVLVGQDYAQKKNTGKMVGSGGSFVFSFKANEVCGQELPKLAFEYKRAWETDVAPASTAEVTLKADCEKKQLKMIEDDGSIDVDVNVNEPFEIKIAGNPTTGYKWILYNRDEINQSQYIDQLYGTYKAKDHPKGMVGVGGSFIFGFSVNESACGQQLPDLIFSYQRGDEAVARTSFYRLKLNEEGCKAAAEEKEKVNNTEAKAIDVNNDEVFTVKLDGNPTTGYSWILENEEEISASGIVSKVNDDFVEDDHEEGMVGVGGKFIFEFMVNNACGKQLPNLVFAYKRPWEVDAVEKAEYSLNLKDDNNCAKDVEESKEIKVKNNETFTVELKGNATTGYKWSLVNEEELAASGVVEKVNEEYVEKEHFFGLVGSGGKFVFTFKVNDACGKELPKLSFVHKQPWNEEDPYSEKTEYTLVLKDSCN